MKMARRTSILLVFSVMAGCTVGPDYVRPEVTTIMPETFAGASDVWKLAVPRDQIPRGAWWEVFSDPELDRLEAEAVEGSQRLKAAVAKFAQARAAADVARSGLFPRIGAGAVATRQHDSANRPLNSTGEAAGKGFTYPSFTVPFDLSWEPDLWGRVRRQVESSRAREEAEAAEIESVWLALTAELAADYFALRSLDDERQLLLQSVEAYRRALELVRSRRGAGLVSDLDVAQADTALRTAEALLPPNALARTRFEHAIAVLTGQPAPLFRLPEGPVPPEPPVLPPGLPSGLLERRPDVAAAERRMAAANAGIGVAEAAFYPSLRLGALGGTQSIDSSSLFSAPSRLWALGASPALPLFQGGQLRANVRATRAAWDETVARYRDTVLVAFAEVEDNLAAQRLLADEYERLVVASTSARKQAEIARTRYEHGLVSYLPVVTAETLAFERDRAVVRSRGQRSTAAVALIKSLGGGWVPPLARSLGKPPSSSGSEPSSSFPPSSSNVLRSRSPRGATSSRSRR